MKVILLRDVAKIGKRFSVVEVPNGYAQNRLIPQKDAEPATAANLRKVTEKQKHDTKQHANTLAEARTVAAATASEPLVLTMEANEQGHLFQAVHGTDIAKAAAARNLVVLAASLQLATPIKEVGMHDVTLTIEGISVIIKIEVKAKTK
jgi:large subunit ribosomal protein L9